MIQMKKAILNVAKTAKTYDEFIDRIYALGEWIWISDENINIVEYIGNNNHMILQEHQFIIKLLLLTSFYPLLYNEVH